MDSLGSKSDSRVFAELNAWKRRGRIRLWLSLSTGSRFGALVFSRLGAGELPESRYTGTEFASIFVA